jgi:uncharacterized protein (TIGR02996 family)
MSDREAFLRAIWDRPHDDLPRLIYADWLDEHGEPERAEFIRVQCELESADLPPPRRAQLQARERDLRWRHGRGWGDDFPKDGIGPFYRGLLTFSRGFPVSEYEMSGPEFVAATDELFRSAPLWSVIMHDAGPVLEDVLASPHLGRLYGLSLPGNDLGDVGFAKLAGCPRLADLRVLELSGNSIGAAGLEALAASPYLTRLRTLDLSENSSGDASRPHFTEASIRALAASPTLANVSTLRMRLVDLGRDDWRVLLARFGTGLMWDMTEADLI